MADEQTQKLTREELIEVIERDTDDVEADHMRAEEALLTYIGDVELAAIWKRRAERWWYA